MDLNLSVVDKKIDAISEKIRILMTEYPGSPTVGLLMSGVRSSLEEIVHHLRDGEVKLERAILTLAEMKALIGETNANMRTLRNRYFCSSGEKEFAEELKKCCEEKHG